MTRFELEHTSASKPVRSILNTWLWFVMIMTLVLMTLLTDLLFGAPLLLLAVGFWQVRTKVDNWFIWFLSLMIGFVIALGWMLPLSLVWVVIFGLFWLSSYQKVALLSGWWLSLVLAVCYAWLIYWLKHGQWSVWLLLHLFLATGFLVIALKITRFFRLRQVGWHIN